MIDLTKFYGFLTPGERLKLAIEAAARQDDAEVRKLSETCPQFIYQPQRDLAYTGKHQLLLTMALSHAAMFYKARGSMVAAMVFHELAPNSNSQVIYWERCAVLRAIIESWRLFCDYAGFEPDVVMAAFGGPLEPLLEDAPTDGAEPSQDLIDMLYQGHLRNWGS